MCSVLSSGHPDNALELILDARASSDRENEI